MRMYVRCNQPWFRTHGSTRQARHIGVILFECTYYILYCDLTEFHVFVDIIRYCYCYSLDFVERKCLESSMPRMIFSLLLYLQAVCMSVGLSARRQIVLREATLNLQRPLSNEPILYHRKSQSISRFLSASPSDEDSTDLDKDCKSAIAKVKGWIGLIKNDELTTKERLAKMGISALLSYGWVSNMSYAISISLAWFTFNKQYGITPFAPGQRTKFLAVYSGFFIFNNAVRPIRVGLSIAVTRYFDNFVNYIQSKFKVRKSVAIGIVVFLTNVCGTFGAIGLGISLASAASGVAVFPPRV